MILDSEEERAFWRDASSDEREQYMRGRQGS